jgi:uncharacterized protein (DUF433 family)
VADLHDVRLDRITQNPEVMGGKPCLRGMRVTVGTVVGLVASGHANAEILAAYPYLEGETFGGRLLMRLGGSRRSSSPYPPHETPQRHELNPVTQIMHFASANGMVVFTHDLDFGALLATLPI